MSQSEEARLRAALSRLNVLLIGGDPRPAHIRRLRLDLELDDVIHCPTRKNDASSRRFECKLYAPKLALVVCARGLTRTHHGALLHRMCRVLSIPLLDCAHLPHPDALVAAIIRARLSAALVARCLRLKSGADWPRGNAA